MIEQAKGMIAERPGLDMEQAFAGLRNQGRLLAGWRDLGLALRADVAVGAASHQPAIVGPDRAAREVVEDGCPVEQEGVRDVGVVGVDEDDIIDADPDPEAISRCAS